MRRASLLFFIALALRSVAFLVNKTQNPLFYHPILDGLFHHEWALEILGGNFWGDEVFFRAPLYPYFLAGLYKLSGSSIAFAIAVQHLIGSVSVVLVYVLAREFFTVRVAFIAGLLAALYWPLVYFEGELLIVTLPIAINLLMLIILQKALKNHRLFYYLLAGALLGLSALSRPNILILIAALPLILRYGGGLRTWSSTVKPSTVLLMGALIVVLPVLVRNYVVGRDIVPIASQGGVNFYIGNNAQSNGSQAMVPGARWDLHGTYQGAIELAENDVGRKLRPSEVSNYYLRKAFDFILGSPAQAAPLLLKKLYLFWAGVERSNNKYIQFFWRHFGLGIVPLPGFWLVGPLGLLGGILLWSRRRDFVLLYAFTLGYMASVVLFFVNARFRLPVAPVLIVFAAYGVCHFFDAIRSGSSDLLKLSTLLVLCVAVVDYDYLKFRGVRAYDEQVTHYILGNAYYDMGENDEALIEYETARANFERYPTQGYKQITGVIDYRLGSLYHEKQRYTEAIRTFERLRLQDPSTAEVRYLLADSYLHMNQWRKALDMYRVILERSPNDERALLGLARTHRGLGDPEMMEATLKRLEALYPGNPRVAAEVRAIRTDTDYDGE